MELSVISLSVLILIARLQKWATIWQDRLPPNDSELSRQKLFVIDFGFEGALAPIVIRDTVRYHEDGLVSRSRSCTQFFCNACLADMLSCGLVIHVKDTTHRHYLRKFQEWQKI